MAATSLPDERSVSFVAIDGRGERERIFVTVHGGEVRFATAAGPAVARAMGVYVEAGTGRRLYAISEDAH
jgi:hypothetical protein